jgi:hypothetical protein
MLTFMKWQVYGRKISWIALWCHPQHLCAVTKENPKTLNSDNSQPAHKFLNLGHPEYEAGVPTTLFCCYCE